MGIIGNKKFFDNELNYNVCTDYDIIEQMKIAGKIHTKLINKGIDTDDCDYIYFQIIQTFQDIRKRKNL